ncbi:hypothetical protein QE152_g30239 [Popillia japonica]|uniref:Uncharacterized protein n=1 Tax=Popillia japonica TaxID=7064 RepID=A0AAW1JEE2_POPJA
MTNGTLPDDKWDLFNVELQGLYDSQPRHSRAGSQEDEFLCISKNVESKPSLLNNNFCNLINVEGIIMYIQMFCNYQNLFYIPHFK